MIVEDVRVDSLAPHPRNPRQGDVGAIVASMERFGVYQPIVVQKSSRLILAGNHRWKAAKALGAETMPVVWADVSDEEALAILVADNRTSDLATYDEPALAELLVELAKEDALGGTGFDGEDLDRLLADIAAEPVEEPSTVYTAKVESPVYEPRGDRPPVSALADTERRDALLASIEKAADLPPDVATFLRLAAHRHVRFDYEAVAEWYAHASPEEQRLVEESALVIIDFDQAVERGFVGINEALGEAFSRDYPDA